MIGKVLTLDVKTGILMTTEKDFINEPDIPKVGVDLQKLKQDVDELKAAVIV